MWWNASRERVLEVDHRAALVAVVVLEIGVGRRTDVERPASRVRTGRPLDLDDVRTHIRQQCSGNGPLLEYR
jgi:hypothetical protein